MFKIGAVLVFLYGLQELVRFFEIRRRQKNIQNFTMSGYEADRRHAELKSEHDYKAFLIKNSV